MDDLLNFINKEADQKEGAHKRAKRPPQPIYQRFRAAVSSKPAPVSETPDSSSSETGSETESDEPVSSQEGVTSEEEEGDVTPADVAALEQPAVVAPEVDDGEWQVRARFWWQSLLVMIAAFYTNFNSTYDGSGFLSDMILRLIFHHLC